MIRALVFDLDDTLYPEIEYVKSGFSAVARALGDEALYETMYALFCEAPQGVYQRAGLNEADCRKAMDIYRSHRPKICLPKESRTVLEALKAKGCKTGIITDGRPDGQRNKIDALGLSALVDSILITDELGGCDFRKPNPLAFRIMAKRLDVSFSDMMYVGDNPTKDFYIGDVYPVTTVRLLSEKGTIHREEAYYRGVKEAIRIASLDELLKLV